jgi:hypothetical protein
VVGTTEPPCKGGSLKSVGGGGEVWDVCGPWGVSAGMCLQKPHLTSVLDLTRHICLS